MNIINQYIILKIKNVTDKLVHHNNCKNNI